MKLFLVFLTMIKSFECVSLEISRNLSLGSPTEGSEACLNVFHENYKIKFRHRSIGIILEGFQD